MNVNDLSLSPPVIGILRGVSRSFFAELMPAAFAGGLQAIEVTMNTRDAVKILAENRPRVPARHLLGAGTVRNVAEAQQAIAAGAMFLVTPNLNHRVLQYAAEHRVPVVAGALTPSEVYQAWDSGAAMVKVFPCEAMGGAAYIRSLKGPFDQIPLVAVGGVSLDNICHYFAAGCAAVGVSTALFGSEALANADIKELTKNVKQFIDRVQKYTG